MAYQLVKWLKCCTGPSSMKRLWHFMLCSWGCKRWRTVTAWSELTHSKMSSTVVVTLRSVVFGCRAALRQSTDQWSQCPHALPWDLTISSGLTLIWPPFSEHNHGMPSVKISIRRGKVVISSRTGMVCKGGVFLQCYYWLQENWKGNTWCQIGLCWMVAWLWYYISERVWHHSCWEGKVEGIQGADWRCLSVWAMSPCWLPGDCCK